VCVRVRVRVHMCMQAMYEASRELGLGGEVKRRIMMGTYALSAGYYDAFYKRAQQVGIDTKRGLLRCLPRVQGMWRRCGRGAWVCLPPKCMGVPATQVHGCAFHPSAWMCLPPKCVGAPATQVHGCACHPSAWVRLPPKCVGAPATQVRGCACHPSAWVRLPPKCMGVPATQVRGCACHPSAWAGAPTDVREGTGREHTGVCLKGLKGSKGSKGGWEPPCSLFERREGKPGAPWCLSERK